LNPPHGNDCRVIGLEAHDDGQRAILGLTYELLRLTRVRFTASRQPGVCQRLPYILCLDGSLIPTLPLMQRPSQRVVSKRVARSAPGFGGIHVINI
jgi:hypothetical protein